MAEFRLDPRAGYMLYIITFNHKWPELRGKYTICAARSYADAREAAFEKYSAMWSGLYRQDQYQAVIVEHNLTLHEKIVHL